MSILYISYGSLPQQICKGILHFLPEFTTICFKKNALPQFAISFNIYTVYTLSYRSAILCFYYGKRLLEARLKSAVLKKHITVSIDFLYENISGTTLGFPFHAFRQHCTMSLIIPPKSQAFLQSQLQRQCWNHTYSGVRIHYGSASHSKAWNKRVVLKMRIALLDPIYPHGNALQSTLQLLVSAVWVMCTPTIWKGSI